MKSPSPGFLRFVLTWLWPPWWFSGIHVEHISANWLTARVAMHDRRYNGNFVGTHFGGNLFAMTDPFYMIMLMQAMGPEYRVWDRHGSIEFVKPGRGKVVAYFEITADRLAALHQETEGGAKALPEFEIPITDEAGDVVAVVRKTVYVRRKQTSTKSAA